MRSRSHSGLEGYTTDCKTENSLWKYTLILQIILLATVLGKSSNDMEVLKANEKVDIVVKTSAASDRIGHYSLILKSDICL